jgi:hypothetical protein
MNRPAVTFAAILCSLALAPGAFAQAAKATATKPTTTSKAPSVKDAVPATAAAAPSPELMRARMRPPVKGTAYIEIIKGQSKTIGQEIVTVTKVKNVSNAPIVGLRIDEYWYAGKTEASLGTYRSRQAIAPGEIVDAVTSSPVKPGLTGSQLQFSHANGNIKPTPVKKFTEDKK